MEALPGDGDWVTPDQWKAWSQMDEESQNRYIRGSWDFKIDGQFMTAFNREKHLRSNLKFDPNLEIWLSFDFNVDPMTCVVSQTDYQNRIATIKEFRQPNSDTFALCKEIKAHYGKHKHMIIVTGDASGNNRNASVSGSMTQYQIIQRELQLSMQQFKVGTHNPELATSRTFCNSILQNYPTIDAEQCPYLIKDLQFVMTGRDPGGKIGIQKTGMNKAANVPNQQLGHLLDCYRYFLHRSHPGWLKIPKS
jgi:phage terminase large subunit